MKLVNDLVKIPYSEFSADGNAFALMTVFKKYARKQKVPQEIVDNIIDMCMSSDYDNLLQVLTANIKFCDK